MPTFLLDHLEGCRPLSPCASCRAVAFLREKLPEKDFRELLEIATMGDASVPKKNPVASPDLQIKSIGDLGLSTRGVNCLKAKGVLTFDDVCKKTVNDLSKISGLGIRSIKQIKKSVEKAGRRLGEKQPKAK